MGKHFNALVDIALNHVHPLEFFRDGESTIRARDYLLTIIGSTELITFPIMLADVVPLQQTQEYLEYMKDCLMFWQSQGELFLPPFQITAVENIACLAIFEKTSRTTYRATFCRHCYVDEGVLGSTLSIARVTMQPTKEPPLSLSVRVLHEIATAAGRRAIIDTDRSLAEQLIDALQQSSAAYLDSIAFAMDPENVIALNLLDHPISVPPQSYICLPMSQLRQYIMQGQIDRAAIDYWKRPVSGKVHLFDQRKALEDCIRGIVMGDRDVLIKTGPRTVVPYKS